MYTRISLDIYIERDMYIYIYRKREKCDPPKLNFYAKGKNLSYNKWDWMWIASHRNGWFSCLCPKWWQGSLQTCTSSPWPSKNQSPYLMFTPDRLLSGGSKHASERRSCKRLCVSLGSGCIWAYIQYIYIYMHIIYIYIYMYMYMHKKYMHTCTRINMYRYTYTCIHNVRRYIYIYI